MTVLDALFQLFIGPLELFFEVVFAFAERVTGDVGLSIIFLSLAMNFLVLPLYRQADAMQEAERDRANAMKHWTEHIKKTFTGDERFMMLQTYQRQCGYKPTDALRGSVSLLLEIPFFIAAYHFLSNLNALNGVPLGPIPDLGAPDALLSVGGVTINVLPILMTVINVVAAAIYMKGFPLKSKIQMYGIAAIFLVLLYNSPAGLVFYWTLNNVFSLVKNIFYKLKNPKLVLCVLSTIAGTVCLVIVIFVHPMHTARLQAAVVAGLLLLQLPLPIHLASRKRPAKERRTYTVTKEDDRAFLFSGIFLALLTGLLIPTAVIESSPLEFVDVTDFSSPLWNVAYSLLMAIGVFVIWFGIFYRLASPRGKKIFSVVMWVLAGVATVNYLFFGLNYGNLSASLQFDTNPQVALTDVLINLAVVALVAVVLIVLWKKKRALTSVVVVSLCLVAVSMSGMNIVKINGEIASAESLASVADRQASIPLSKTGKNVVVLMLDRAISDMLPELMEERPDLKRALDGFTYYPNTMSFGSATNYGVPGIYGGYEYVPEEMNARPNESLQEKNDEALKVMPVLFDENDYKVTVCDPTYAGYSWVADLSIYDDYPDIKAYITKNGQFSVEGFESVFSVTKTKQMLRRNFFCYGIFRIAPVAIQPTLYARGAYNAVGVSFGWQTRDGASKASGLKTGFMNSFGVLDSLPNMTNILDEGDDSKGTFLMMSNDTTHDVMLLEEPSYLPAQNIDNTEYDAQHKGRYDGDDEVAADDLRAAHYHSNMGAFLKLGEWFDYLREQGVYDNTRIIVVSDHAFRLGRKPELVMDPKEKDYPDKEFWDLSIFNCMLLVKDFNAKGFKTDETFMTNADTPTIAMGGLIENPTNPFTGKKIDSSDKDKPEQHVAYVKVHQTSKNNGNTFIPTRFFSVHDDVRDIKNWEYLGIY